MRYEHCAKSFPFMMISRFLTLLILVVFLGTLTSCVGEKEDELLLAKARKLQEETKYEEAISLYENLISQFPESPFLDEARKGITFSNDMITISRKTLAMNAVEDLKMLAHACEQYKSKNGQYPDSLDSLVPDFIKAIPVDPWGNNYYYKVKSSGTKENNAYNLASFGQDGIPGGEEDNIDQIVEDGEFIQKHKWLR